MRSLRFAIALNAAPASATSTAAASVCGVAHTSLFRSCPRTRASRRSGSPLSQGRAEKILELVGVGERRKRRLRDLDVLLDLGAASRDRADHLAANFDREAARHVGEITHAH